MKRWILSGVLLMSWTAFAFAGPKGGSVDPDSLQLIGLQPTFRLPGIVVTATKSPQKIMNLSVATSIVPAVDLKMRMANQITEMLNDVPGVFAVQSGLLNNSSFRHLSGSSFTIRGMSAITMIDGRPVMMGIFNHPIPHSLNAGPWSRVEIVRGPSAILYGSDATGGVVNLISDIPARPYGAEVSLRGGSFDTRTGRAHAFVSRKRFAALLSYAADQSDGHRRNGNYLSHDVFGRGWLQLSRHVQLSASYKRYRGKWNDPGPVQAPFSDHWYDFTRRGGDVQLSFSAEKFYSSLQLYRTEGHHAIFDGWLSDDFTNGLKWFARSRLLPQNETIVGVDLRKFGGKQLTSGRSWQEQELAPYLLVQQGFGLRWTATAGFRLNHHSTYGNIGVPTFGLVYQWSPFTSLRFNYGEGFKSPSIMQLYLFPPSNPKLKPERSRNIEVGLRKLVSQKWFVDIAAYQLKGTDLIQLYRDPETGRPSFRNVGEFTFRGVELGSFLSVNPYLKIRLSYTYQDVGSATGFRPRHHGSLIVTYVHRQLTLQWRNHGVAGLYGENGRKSPLPNFWIVDLFADYQVFPGVEIKLAARNLLDQTYYYEPGYPMPPRNFEIGISYSFSGE